MHDESLDEIVSFSNRSFFVQPVLISCPGLLKRLFVPFEQHSTVVQDSLLSQHLIIHIPSSSGVSERVRKKTNERSNMLEQSELCGSVMCVYVQKVV